MSQARRLASEPAPVVTDGRSRNDPHLIHHRLRSAILSRRIDPGTKLAEEELAGIYEVSRTVIRSALQLLAHDRLVVLERNRGAFVARPGATEAREVFEVRCLVEPRTAALAASCAKADDVRMLRSHIDQEHAALARGDDSAAIGLSAAFHITIAEIAHHQILADLVRDLVSRSSLIVSLYWRRRDTLCEHHAHDALVEAIGSHQSERAADLMRSHIVDLLSGLDLRERGTLPESLVDRLS